MDPILPLTLLKYSKMPARMSYIEKPGTEQASVTS